MIVYVGESNKALAVIAQANQLYPFAVSLMESVRTYESVLRKIEERPGIAPLLAQLKKDLHATLMEG